MAITTTTLVAGALVVGASAAAANSAKKGAEGAAAAQRRALEEAQAQLAESNIEAAGLISSGQDQAAAAILQAGEAAAAATLEAAALARAQIERFFKIAKADIAEKLAQSRIDIQNGVDVATAILEPFKQQGLIAGRELASMIGIADDSGQVVPFDQNKLEQTPQFQFQLSQGLKAIDRGSRTKLSGGQLKDLQAFGNGLASNVFNERINQLLSQQGIGLDAAGGQAQTQLSGASLLSSANQNASGNLARAAGGAGSQNAQIALNTGNALSNIALSQGGALAQNATQGANALAANAQGFGQNNANLSLGLGSINANEIAARANANAGFFNTVGTVAGFGLGGGFGTLYSQRPTGTTSGGNGVVLDDSTPNNRLVL